MSKTHRSMQAIRKRRDQRIRVAWAFLSFMLSDAVMHLDLTADAWIIRRQVFTYVAYFSGETRGPIIENDSDRRFGK